MTKLLFSILLFACVPCAAQAGVTLIEIDSTNPTPSPGPSGFVTNDIRIDFTGQYFGSQLLTSELGAGAIFHQALVGIGATGNVTPNPAFFGAFSDLEFDSYVANGGLTTSDSTFQLGGAAVNLLGGVRSPTFDDSQVDQAWNPSPGVNPSAISDKAGYVTARLTLRSDVNGTFQYLASAGDVDDLTIVSGTIVNGVMSTTAVPEPSAWLFMSMVGCAVGCHRRWR